MRKMNRSLVRMASAIARLYSWPGGRLARSRNTSCPLFLRPTGTLREQSQLPKCLGGGSRTRKDRYDPAVISALLPNAGWLFSHVHPHQREVCPLAGGVISPHGSTPIRPITDRPSLAPSS